MDLAEAFGKSSVTPNPTAIVEKRAAALAIPVAAALLVVALLAALAIGPVPIAPQRVAAILLRGADGNTTRDSLIVLEIRLPRALLAALVGSGTAVAGAVMQGLFRNPIADPGIIGVSSGAALAAALWFMLGRDFSAVLPQFIASFGLPAAALLGALAVTSLLHFLSRRGGQTSVVTLALAGVALSALAGAIVGILVFMSSDQQLREFTFWTLGSFGGATFFRVILAAPFIVGFLLLSPFLARGLDALSLGEAEAFHLGVDVESTKRLALFGVAAAVGAAVAVSGIIGFVGLAVPHLARLIIGPSHRALLIVSAVAGAALMVATDLVARTVAAPVEIPVGIVTAAFGAPFMLWLLLKRRDLALF